MKYAKTIVAVLVAGLTTLYAALTDGHVTPQEWVAIALAAAGAVGVYVVPNRAQSSSPVSPRRTS